MNKTIEHRNKILALIKGAGDHGINSKILINQVTPRWSARKRELVKEGYIFKTRRDPIGGSNFTRLWYMGKRDGEQIIESRKPTRYEFVGDVAIPIYQ